MKLSRADTLNALVTDLVADQVRRALDMGFLPKEVEEAVLRGMGHGVAEYQQGQAIMEGGKNERR